MPYCLRVGPAFDVIDNFAAAGMNEYPSLPTSQPSASTAPGEEGSIGLYTPNVVPTTSVAAPPTGFMQSLTMEAMQSKSDIPGSLKSTYGAGGVGALESLEEAMTPTPEVDLTKELKSDLVQMLPGSKNEPLNPEQKEQGGDETFHPSDDLSSSELGLHEPVSTLRYDASKAMKSEVAHPFLPPSSNTKATRLPANEDLSRFKLAMDSPDSSIAQVPRITSGDPIPNSSEHMPLEPPANRDGLPSFSGSSVTDEGTPKEYQPDEEDKLMSTHYYSANKGSKIQPMGGVPLTSTSSNRNMTMADMLKESKDHIGLADEKVKIRMTSDISLVKQQSLSHRFEASPKQFSDSLHHKEQFRVPVLVTSPNVSGPDLVQSHPDPREHRVGNGLQDNHQLDDDQPNSSSPDVLAVASSPVAVVSQEPSVSQSLPLATRSPVLNSRSFQPLPSTSLRQGNQGLEQSFSPAVTSGKFKQDVHREQLGSSVSSLSLKVQTVQEDSDSDDTETDEEIRGSQSWRLNPTSLRLRHDIDPMSSVERDDIQRTPSPTVGVMEFAGAWNKEQVAPKPSGVYIYVYVCFCITLSCVPTTRCITSVMEV